MAQLVPHIHFEKQEKGSMLCAQHALNALLQGSYYDATQLSDIAQTLDDLERQQLNADAFAARDAQSLNMDDTGFFSVSVIENALQVWALSLVRWRSEAMKQYQGEPESQLGFLLNLNSHWFSFRSFGRNPDYWYNLNSFLPEPSWVGRNYLGALLDSAETEGYSVFVVRPVNGNTTPAIFKTSTADEIASTLSAPSASGAPASTASLGLKPEAEATSPETAGHLFGTAHDDEDADLQAALRASMADADIDSDSDPYSAASKLTEADRAMEQSRVKNQALLAQMQREQEGAYHGALAGPDYAVNYGYGPGVVPPRDRSGIAGVPSSSATRPRSADMDQESGNEVEERDVDIDNIAPSRRRQRLGSRTVTGDFEGSAHSSSSRLSTLPSASGARRRGRHAADAEADGQSRHPARDNRSRTSSVSISNSGSGATRTSAIEIADESSDFEGEDQPAARQPRSPFLAAVHDDAVDVDALESDEEGDNDDVIFAGAAFGNRQDPLERAQAHLAAIEGGIRDRQYDDEDAELQAALAASLGDPTALEAWQSTSNGAGNNVAPVADMPEWLAQFANEKSPPPADVGRIARMREEARRREREDAEIRARGEDPEALREEERKRSEAAQKKGEEGQEDDGDEEEEEEEPVQLTPAQIREQRLKRFG